MEDNGQVLSKKETKIKQDIEQSVKRLELTLEKINKKLKKHNLFIDLQADFKKIGG